MQKENFIRAFQFLEEGYLIQSLISDKQIKKIDGDYYWRRNAEGSKYQEWQLCKLDEGLFLSGEVQGKWSVTTAK